MASATSNYLMDKGFTAAAALTKFRAVKFSAEETVTPVTAATDAVAGVAQFGVSAGEITKGKGATVRMAGISLMEASEALVPGNLISITSTGLAQVAGTTERQIGICVQGASGSGKYAAVELSLPGTLVV